MWPYRICGLSGPTVSVPCLVLPYLWPVWPYHFCGLYGPTVSVACMALPFLWPVRPYRFCGLSGPTVSMACLALPFLWPVWLYLSGSTVSVHISKRHDFWNNNIQQLMCVLLFSQLLSETFFILRRNEQDIPCT